MTVIADAHLAADRNRDLQLQEVWQTQAEMPQCPNGLMTSARKCRHCNVRRESSVSSNECAYHLAYPNCPNQVQCPAMPIAIATLYRNVNAIWLANLGSRRIS